MKLLSLLLHSLTILALCIPSRSQAQYIEVRKAEFRSVYDLSTLCPHQVTYTLTAADICRSQREPSWPFVNDLSADRAVARTSDFVHSGYDRGHLCPAADRSRSINDMRSTFVMSNIAPQAPTVNRGAWKQTETYLRRLASQYDSIYILVMPIFLPRDTLHIGRHRLAVPHAFLKAAWVPPRDSVIATWFIFNH